MAVHIYGIRHHGPGCARSLVAALTKQKPDIVLIEGPPEASEVISFAGKDGMKPPVAILVYPIETPSLAVFYPFASFSPEWQSLCFAIDKQTPVRFIDLPLVHRFPISMKKQEEMLAAVKKDEEEQNAVDAEHEEEKEEQGTEAEPTSLDPLETNIQHDPIGVLAEAAGYSDKELWWEHQIEQRLDPTGLFQGIMEAMTALREDAKPPAETEALREAHMRQSIRLALKEGFKNIAVVCGAWHAPVLVNLDDQAGDTKLLSNLPKTKVQATWVPWSYDRLSYRSGYGAGIDSPGWYAHLWKYKEKAGVRWATRAARLLREEDLDASSASVIETVRLAECLATLRGIPLPGLMEQREAILTVLCHGDSSPLELVRKKLEVGKELGKVPEGVPAVPLQKDLEGLQKSLRLKVTTEIIKHDFDLRNTNDLARSHLLHRLNLLDIPWGKTEYSNNRTSTFHELWQTKWDAEYVVAIVEASVWGNTIAEAATNKVRKAAEELQELPHLTELLQKVILADLPDVVMHILDRLENVAALATDVTHLTDALPPLVQVTRYGDVRKTKASNLMPIIEGLLERILIGLSGACGSLDDDAAAKMVTSIGHVNQSLNTLQLAEVQKRWYALLERMLDQDVIHGLVRGWCCRTLLDQQVLSDTELYRRTRLALSPAVPLAQAASWMEGLLQGSGMVLIHSDAVWVALDSWLRDISEEAFPELLPILRRAFGNFEPPERRMMAEKIKKIDKLGAKVEKEAASKAKSGSTPNERNIDEIYPVLAHVIGIEWP